TFLIEGTKVDNKLGKKVIMVVEKLEELRHVITVSTQIGVKPLIGIRVRLHTKSAGKWALSGGEDAKFGLNTADILEATKMLQEAGLEESFKLLHFHIGSQVPDIRTVKKSVREAARYFAKIYQHGFKLEYIDVGGGLGVDYDGSRTNCESSINYTLSEYARDIVYNIADVLNEEKVPHPHIVSESGRAIVAHHSVLIVDVFGMIEKTKTSSNVTYEAPNHKLVQDLLDLRQTLNKKNRLEHFHDMQQIKEDSETRFELGLLDLKTQAQIETLYWELAESLVELYNGTKSVPQEIQQLKNSLGDQYICNFSVFQSMLDHWALGQLFPIMPIHRLEEQPDYNGFLVDITCDSDGKINSFITGENKIQKTLPLHSLNGNPYCLGLFLMGAYQDIMGDLHNLFGRVNEAHIFLDPDEPSGFYIEETIPGTTIGSVLADVQYDTISLAREMKQLIDAAIKSDVLKPSEGMRLLESYEKGLDSSTYLQFD
ncbi:MAG: biosynthetic arginine decarboxylase, partial [Verrucomicrobiota bacterium]